MKTNFLRNLFLVLIALVLGVVILGFGFFFGRTALAQTSNWPGWMHGNSDDGGYPGGMMGGGMMGGFSQSQTGDLPQDCPFAGQGMMGRQYGNAQNEDFQSCPYGAGMPGGSASGEQSSAAPLTIDQAKTAVLAYLDGLDDPNLALKEVMIFDNQAYAEIVELDTGIGAMEVLVDPVTLAVYPEHGPNMMWNLKYGMMAGRGMMGRMMGGWGARPNADSEMTVSPEEALQIAQDYLDQHLPGTQVGDETDPFYGYYTLHTEQDGQVIGMLSVNGYTGDVFLHTWHGKFIEMEETEH